MEPISTAPQQVMTPPPDAVLMQLLFAPLLQQSIYVAAKLKLADWLVQPTTIAELAAHTETQPEPLYRMLRMLASVGIFHENQQHQFELTPLASLLRSDIPDSMYSFTRVMGEEWLWKNWRELLHCVKTGETAQRKVHGMSSYEYFTVHPQAGDIFNQAMTNLSASVVPAIVEAYDFSALTTIADVAGGHGRLLAGILNANPSLNGILFDVPEVIEGAGSVLAEEGLLDRVELVAGDFLVSIPAGADLYILKHIVHDWNDEINVKILSNIHVAMTPTSKLIIVEMVVPEDNQPSPAKIMDLSMMVIEGAKSEPKRSIVGFWKQLVYG